MNLEKSPSENTNQYLWRIGNLIDQGVIENWESVTDIVNEQLNKSYGESAYRKKYRAARDFKQDVFDQDNDDVAKLVQLKHEITMERQRLTDERAALNRTLRVESRVSTNLDYLESLIKQTSNKLIPRSKITNITKNNDTMVICLSDYHYGLDVDNSFGVYNPEVAMERLGIYLDAIERKQLMLGCKDAVVICLGDMVNGSIHLTTQLENRENVTRQVQGAADTLSTFVSTLVEMFEKVTVCNVGGNHSRIAPKDLVLRDERLDNLIPWYMKAKLSQYDNVMFLENDIDTTIGIVDVNDKTIAYVHGDNDSFDTSGVSKLVMMLGFAPDVIVYGHKHKCSYDEISGIKIIRSGSFAGTADDYCISKRISGEPSQMIFVVPEDYGNKDVMLFPINLTTV